MQKTDRVTAVSHLMGSCCESLSLMFHNFLNKHHIECKTSSGLSWSGELPSVYITV